MGKVILVNKRIGAALNEELMARLSIVNKKRAIILIERIYRREFINALRHQKLCFYVLPCRVLSTRYWHLSVHDIGNILLAYSLVPLIFLELSSLFPKKNFVLLYNGKLIWAPKTVVKVYVVFV